MQLTGLKSIKELKKTEAEERFKVNINFIDMIQAKQPTWYPKSLILYVEFAN